MPYHIVKADGKECVRKKGSEKNLGCHEDHTKAVAQMRALYASESKEVFIDLPLFEASLEGDEETKERSLNERMSAVEAAVRERYPSSEDSWTYPREVYDDHVIVSGSDGLFKLLYGVNAEGGVELGTEVTPVRIAYEEVKESQETVTVISLEEVAPEIKKSPPSEKKSILETIKDAIRPKPATLYFGPAFTIHKQKDGRYRFLTRVSNNFKDRDQEIFAASAHKDFVEWVDENKVFPELWLWHTKGTRWGQVDVVDYADGFLVESGLIDADKEHIIERLKDRKIGVSHGFFPLAKKGGVYYKYRQFEVSVLDADYAANPWTDFSVVETGMNDTKKKFLEDAGTPPELIKTYEADTSAMAETLKTLGIEFKEADTIAGDVAAIASAVKGLAEAQAQSIKALTDTVTELQKTVKDGVDAGVAAAITPPAAPVGVAPSESKENLVSENEKPKETEDWMKEVVFDPMLTGGKS